MPDVDTVQSRQGATMVDRDGDRAAQARATEDVDLPAGGREGGYDRTDRATDDRDRLRDDQRP